MVNNSSINVSFADVTRDQLASTEEWETNKIVTWGMQQENGRSTRHITVDFGQQDSLYNQAVRFMNGEIDAKQFLLNDTANDEN